MLFDTPAAKAALHAKVSAYLAERSRRLSPRRLVGFGWRRGLYRRLLNAGRLWGRRRFKLSQRRAQRIETRSVRKPVVCNDLPDCRCCRGELVVGEVNRRHGAALSL